MNNQFIIEVYITEEKSDPCANNLQSMRKRTKKRKKNEEKKIRRERQLTNGDRLIEQKKYVSID